LQRVWRIELLGTLKGIRHGQELTRFRTRRVASLLAYLAYFRQRVHSRDEISEMLWPDVSIDTSRRNLRQALSSLRHALEPAPLPKGSVILTIHDGVQLNPETFTTDVSEFEALIAQSKREERPARVIELLNRAVDEYKGDLLPGFNDEWIWAHRLRLEDLYLSALRRLGAEEPSDAAIDHLRIGVIREPFNENWHIELMRRYLEIDRPENALDQFSALEAALADSFGQSPSRAAVQLAEQAQGQIASQGKTVHRKVRPRQTSSVPEPIVSLPVFTNRYFGREAEIQTICSMLEQSRSRLVTILGPAGVGKTRISVQCARRISENQAWSVWFVPLADRFNAVEIPEAIIAAMDSQHGSSSSEVDRVSELIGERKTLLVLDNLEQIAEEAGTVIASLLERAPNLACLTSSRQPLHIAGEQIVGIEPLPLPSSDQMELTELAANPSIQLFVDRCQALRPDLQLNERNAQAIVDLCERLDGLPLAIEIAAGLSNSFSPAQMATHLPLRLTSLTSRRRDVPARHKSLRAAIDWSYDSLPPELQALFTQVCVFRGGFTLEAASEVCFGATSGEADLTQACFPALQGLQERSLVRCQPAEDGRAPRFTVLVAFREYAEERISAGDILSLRERHAQYFVRQAPQDRPFQSIVEQTARHLAIELDYENYTSAIEFSLDCGNVERCVRLLGILAVRWLARGPKATERRLIREIAHRPELTCLSAHLRVQVERMLGTTFIRSGEYKAAYEACSRAAQIAIEEEDPVLLATCYSGLSVCAGYLGQLDECVALNQKVLQLVGSENLNLAERSYLGMGSVYCSQGRMDEASMALEKARAISERLRGGEPDALIVINQARVALDLGRFGEALRLAHEAIRISRRLHDDFTLAVALTVVSRYHVLNGNLEAAEATNLEALERCKQGDFLFWILQCLRCQALIWIEAGRYVDAATLLAAASETTSSDCKFDNVEEERGVERIRKALTAHAFESAWAKGLAMDRNDAIRMVSQTRS